MIIRYTLLLLLACAGTIFSQSAIHFNDEVRLSDNASNSRPSIAIADDGETLVLWGAGSQFLAPGGIKRGFNGPSYGHAGGVLSLSDGSWAIWSLRGWYSPTPPVSSSADYKVLRLHNDQLDSTDILQNVSNQEGIQGAYGRVSEQLRLQKLIETPRGVLASWNFYHYSSGTGSFSAFTSRNIVEWSYQHDSLAVIDDLEVEVMPFTPDVKWSYPKPIQCITNSVQGLAWIYRREFVDAMDGTGPLTRSILTYRLSDGNFGDPILIDTISRFKTDLSDIPILSSEGLFVLRRHVPSDTVLVESFDAFGKLLYCKPILHGVRTRYAQDSSDLMLDLDIVPFSDKRFAVVWSQADSAGGYTVFTALFDSAWSMIAKPRQVNSSLGKLNSYPKLAAHRDTISVVWRLYDGQESHIYYRRFSVDQITGSLPAPTPSSLALNPPWPNPISAGTPYVILSVNTREHETVHAALFDLLGKKLDAFSIESAAGKRELLLNTSDLQRGIYIIALGTGNWFATTRLVVR